MLKKILKLLAAFALIAVLSFAIVAIYTFSTVEIMKSGLNTLVGKDVYTSFEPSKEYQSVSQMRLIWIDKNYCNVTLIAGATPPAVRVLSS